jgi:hypothetical protein
MAKKKTSRAAGDVAVVKLMHWRSLQNPNFTGHYTLLERGLSELEVLITKVSKEPVLDAHGQGKMATLLHMEGMKPLWLNTINQKTIERVLGTPFVQEWVGKRITLFVDKVKIESYSGLASIEDMFVDAIRIREFATKDDAEPLTPDHPKFMRIKQGIAQKSITMQQILSKYTIDNETREMLLSTDL